MAEGERLKDLKDAVINAAIDVVRARQAFLVPPITESEQADICDRRRESMIRLDGAVTALLKRVEM